MHPAKALFKTMFEAASVDPGPELPTHFVPQNVFFAAVHKANIEAPKDIVGFWQWEEAIGLVDFAHRLFSAYHKP